MKTIYNVAFKKTGIDELELKTEYGTYTMEFSMKTFVDIRKAREYARKKIEEEISKIADHFSNGERDRLELLSTMEYSHKEGRSYDFGVVESFCFETTDSVALENTTSMEDYMRCEVAIIPTEMDE